ncbi:MAG TPA: hypothetical protein VLT62_17745 [Candidatus Methylomirabilis sp.]|nr:hypothetical protein [Candidatus Methylomirabilis sp.]
MTAIDVRYQQVIQANPWIGAPTGPEQDCGDGKGRFRDYQGGASIYYTPTTGAHLIYGLIRAKWTALGRQKGPNGYPISDEADAGSGKGRFNNFQNGTIIWKRDTPEAFSVYGAIYGKWGTVQYDMGPLGFPLTDESPTAGNTGRYNDFEHGAIYYNATTGTHIVRSPILEAWSVADREKGLLKFPTSDTPATKDGQDAYTQAFQGGRISCTEGASRSLVSSSHVTCRIQPLTRAIVLVDSDKLDTRVCNLTRLNRHLQLKTALVIFRGSCTRSLDDAEIEVIKNSYAQAKAKIDAFSFGLGRIKSTTVVIESVLKKSDFVDLGSDGNASTFQAEFSAYSKVIAALQANGFTAEDFDIVSINIPWADTATDRASGLAWANPSSKLGNSKTWSTVHYIYPGPTWGTAPAIWWAFYVHETTHCLEWMLEGHGYPQLRNNDDAWWAAAYPQLTSSSVVPPPENLENPGDPRLYAMHQRIKSDWFNLSPTWGQIITDATSLENYGKILMYSCPDRRTVVETAWNTKYLDTGPTPAECQGIGAKIKSLEGEKQHLQADLQEASPGGKPAIAEQIKQLSQQISHLKQEFAVCVEQQKLISK